ncbi:DUF1214 domain-containing protein [Candidatus Colwellia aromaticivorans]|uniref:DUF1214 domain-containing protein n=1 Tax=Candidatus Colwellia aromaticivorans TaxID=2267621 RepID=UPI000DF19F3A|nr:DUF1214 domain-containing protein [Candidatus Colwellia aromaticivorans]
MKKFILSVVATSLLTAISITSQAQTKLIDVNLDNLTTVESHIQFDRYQQFTGINEWFHLRVPTDIDNQTTIAMNRDTLYSFIILDLKEPVTITYPENEGRYLSLQVIDENHYVYDVFTKAGQYTLTQEEVGSRYATMISRVFIDPDSTKDVSAAHQLQDGLKAESTLNEKFILPNYDMERYKALFSTVQSLINFAHKDTHGSMGKRDEVDSLKHTIATVAGWGLLPAENAMYQPVQLNLDTNKRYKIDVPSDVPVDAFWSISMYNSDGFFVKNELEYYSLNSVTAKTDKSGSYTIHLGGCEDARINCLPFAGEGFYYQWRMYQPGEEFINGTYQFNLPEEVK